MPPVVTSLTEQFGEQIARCVQHSTDLQRAAETLNALRELGVLEAFKERRSAIPRIKEWLRDGNNQRFVFVGTSLRGLLWDREGDTEVLELIRKRLAAEKELVQSGGRSRLCIRFLFTHPAFAYLRQEAEGDERQLADTSIREEILITVLKLRKYGIEPGWISFFLGTPTMFGVMSDNAMFINPYPYKKQSYTSFGLIIQKTRVAVGVESLYDQLCKSHFQGVLDDRRNTATWKDDDLDTLWRTSLETVSRDRGLADPLPNRLREMLKDVTA